MAPSTTSKLFIEFSTSSTLPIKLFTDNYHTWFKHVYHLLVASDTIGYVTGTTSCPPTTIGTDKDVTANPNHSRWVRQDHYVYLALLGSCRPEAQVVISSPTSSANAWIRLMKACVNRSHTRIMSLKERLASITKGNSSISEYLQSIRFLADELALIGDPVNDLDLVIATLRSPGFKMMQWNWRKLMTDLVMEMHGSLYASSLTQEAFQGGRKLEDDGAKVAQLSELESEKLSFIDEEKLGNLQRKLHIYNVHESKRGVQEKLHTTSGFLAWLPLPLWLIGMDSHPYLNPRQTERRLCGPADDDGAPRHMLERH
ncbi:hypothetical protein V8G54_002599 [Vigna mungo]|uniref:Retrotransposon Copia-like N-terminal domain-containing protein n=1 Tax=Vigna mungo TaxID=3915 RepID=A0AAQ3PAI0_VIGMU